jgi:beta-galactosidase
VIGDGFEVGFSRGSGVIRRATAGGHAVLLSGPSLHILPADPAANDVPAPEGWTLNSFDVDAAGDRAVVSVRGGYPDLVGTYRTTVDASGEIVATYDFVYSGKALLAREIGLKLGLPENMDTLRWERNGEWTWYPEDHIGRNRGTAHAHADHPSSVPPKWAFALDDSMLGTNDFRSQKRNFTKASLIDKNGYGVALGSDGSQHVRAQLESDRIALHVNDWFGGTWSRDEWRHFGKGKQIAPGDRLQGTIRFRLLARKAAVDATASRRPVRDHRPQ